MTTARELTNEKEISPDTIKTRDLQVIAAEFDNNILNSLISLLQSQSDKIKQTTLYPGHVTFIDYLQNQIELRDADLEMKTMNILFIVEMISRVRSYLNKNEIHLITQLFNLSSFDELINLLPSNDSVEYKKLNDKLLALIRDAMTSNITTMATTSSQPMPSSSVTTAQTPAPGSFLPVNAFFSSSASSSNAPMVSEWYEEDARDRRTLNDIRRHYFPRNPGFLDKAKYHGTNTLNRVINAVAPPVAKVINSMMAADIHAPTDWNEIVDGIYLSVVPSPHDIKPLLALAGDAVLHDFSILEEFELKVSPALWEKHGAKCTVLPIPDFTASIEPASIAYIVQKMHEARKRGEIVILHCKAGKARSAMIAVAYLATYPDFYPELKINTHDTPAQRIKKATIYLKKKRPQVDLHHELLQDDDWEAMDKGIFAVPKAGKLFRALQAVQLSLHLNPANDDDVIYDDENDDDENNEIIEQPIHDPEDIFRTLKFKRDFIQFRSFQDIQSYIAKNKNSERSRYLKAFLQDVYHASDSSWHFKLMECFGFLQTYGGAKGDAIPDLDFEIKQLLRIHFGPLAWLVTNSKMGDELYHLFMNLVHELQQYKIKYCKESKIQFKYAPEQLKIELKQKSAAEQYKRDVGIWKKYMSDSKDPVMRRLFLALQHDKLQFKNEKDDKYLLVNSVNHNQDVFKNIPLASLLSHGGRILIQIPPCSQNESQQFFHWLAGGSDKISYNNQATINKDSTIYHRAGATHSLDIINGEVVELKLPAVPVKPNDAIRYITDWAYGHHWGKDLGICEEEYSASSDGAHGHLYIYWLPPTSTQPGGLLIGCEGSSPTGNISYYGDTHDIFHAQQHEFSLTGGMKFKHDSFKTSNIHPDCEGGFKLVLTAQDLKTLLTHDENDFSLETLGQPAGTPGAGYFSPAMKTASSMTPPPRPDKPAPDISALSQASVIGYSRNNVFSITQPMRDPTLATASTNDNDTNSDEAKQNLKKIT